MAFAGVMRLSLQHGMRRTVNPALRASNTRLFSSLLTSYRTQPAVVFPRARYISSTPTPPPDSSVDVPSIPADDVVTPETAEAATGALDAVTDAVIPALQYGDFAALGLASWFTPAGWIRWSLELINVSTGMNWFWTIVVGTALWRAVCVPFTIIGLRETAKAQPHQENLQAFNENIKAAVGNKDMVTARKIQNAMAKYNKEHDLHPLRGALAGLQLPIQLGLFFGVRRMCEEVVQLQYSGIAFLPDLTVADPTYLLPILSVVVLQVQMKFAAADLNTVSNPLVGHMMNFFRFISPVFAFAMSGFPAGLFVSLVTTSTLITIQSALLRAPAVRRALNIPIPPASSRGKLPTFKETYLQTRNWLFEQRNQPPPQFSGGRAGIPRRQINKVTYELPKKMPNMDQKTKP